jgi:hypothetical protein
MLDVRTFQCPVTDTRTLQSLHAMPAIMNRDVAETQQQGIQVTG